MRRENDERAEALVEAWVAQTPPGSEPPVEQWVLKHPDLADELRTAADALRRLGRLAPRGPTPAPPERIGEYRILREIGRGGMGVVYEAEQDALMRRVALKVLYPSITNSAKAAERFRREARVAGQLKHTNIVTVHQLGEHDGVWFCAMELVDGHSLDKVIDDLRRLGPPDRGTKPAPSSGAADAWRATTGERRYFERVAEMFAEVAEALQLAHDHGVVHRDVKPANLMVSTGGQLRILDFGLARVREEASALTMTGDVVGTPSYMSPEQACSGPVDARTDVWSLGATLYEVVTLKHPFEGTTFPEVCSQIVTGEPVLPSRANGRVPRDLETIVLKAMEKDRDRRYAGAGALAQDLRRFAQGTPVEARRIDIVTRAWRKIKRNKLRSSLAASVLMLAGVAAFLGFRAAEESARRREFEYAQLCAQAQQAVIAELSMPKEERPNSAASILSEAIDLAPERPEAFLGRALTPGRTVDERLRDLGESHARGLSARTWHLARAHFLRIAGRREEADQELARASEERRRDPLDVYFEAFQLATESRWADARELMTGLLSSAERDPIVRHLALNLRAWARSKSGQHSLALEDLVRLQGLGDESTSLRARIASEWRGVDATAAERSFDEVLNYVAASGSERAWRDLCQTMHDNGHYDWMDRAAHRAIEAHPASVELLAERSDALRHLGRHEEALAACDCAIALDPKLVTARNNRGNVLRELGRPEEALAEFDLVIELNPTLAPAHANRGSALHGLSRNEEALAEFDVAIGLDPSSAGAHHNRGNLLCDLGRHEQALRAYDRAIELDPKLAQAHGGRGRMLRALGRPEEALKELDLAIELDPKDAVFYNNRGNALSDLGRPEDALKEYDRAIELDPKATKARCGRAIALGGLGRHKEALEECDRAIEVDPNCANAHVSRGIALASLGRPEEALQEFDLAIGLDPKDADAHGNRGVALHGLGRAKEALEEHDVAIKLDATRPHYHNNRGSAALDLGRREEALRGFDRAIELDPNYVNAHLNRARALCELARYEGAVAAAERALDLLPEHAGAMNNLAWLLATCPQAEVRNPARAVALARRVITAEPGSWTAHNTLGVALYRAGELRDALKVLGESMRLSDGGGACDWFFAAMAHARLGEREEARARFEQAVAWTKEHAPDDLELRRFEEEAAGVLEGK